MPTATVNGTSLYYDALGAGPACLVMHGGLGIDHAFFRPLLDRLAEPGATGLLRPSLQRALRAAPTRHPDHGAARRRRRCSGRPPRHRTCDRARDVLRRLRGTGTRAALSRACRRPGAHRHDPGPARQRGKPRRRSRPGAACRTRPAYAAPAADGRGGVRRDDARVHERPRPPGGPRGSRADACPDHLQRRAHGGAPWRSSPAGAASTASASCASPRW